jgi:hypothetical protein
MHNLFGGALFFFRGAHAIDNELAVFIGFNRFAQSYIK